jgi:hypothetical protein
VVKGKKSKKQWFNASINGSDFTVSGFTSEARCKAHVVKHVLGLKYGDSSWDKERWDQLFYSLTIDRNQVIEQLLAVDCPATRRRDEIREPDGPFICEQACIECEREHPGRCNRVLNPLIYCYREVIKQALHYSHKLPRFTRHIDMEQNQKALEGMYHLDSRGVFVVSRSESSSQPHRLHVVTCYRPVPPIHTKWCEGCLDYAKRSCLKKNSIGRIRILALYNKETWGFKIGEGDQLSRPVQMRPKGPVSPKGQIKPERARSSHELYKLLDERGKSVLDSLKKSLDEGKRKRETQRSNNAVPETGHN